jgi:RNA ligase (TIGR02306 family)
MSSSLIVNVCEVKKVYPHKNADRLELAEIKGWQTVIGKGQYKVGDIVIFIPPDTLVPEELADELGIRNYLGGKDKTRVKTVRLRGEMSFGLTIDIPEGKDWEVGYNCADDLGITKYFPPLRATCGDSAPEDAFFTKYTDIENIRNFPDVIKEGERVIATEKIDGTNCRTGISFSILEDGTETYEWKAGSHKLKRKRPEDGVLKDHIYWYPYTLDSVRNMIETIHNAPEFKAKEITLYGEVYGKTRGGHKSLHYGRVGSLNFVAFDMKWDGVYVSWDIFETLCLEYGVPTVPIVAEFDFSLEQAKALSTGHSLLAEDNGMEEPHMREGIVIKPINERRDPTVGRVVVKFINDDYIILKNKAYDKGEVTDFTDE